VSNRIAVFTGYAKPTAEVACKILSLFHANNPLVKIKTPLMLVASCVQGSLNESLVGDDVFGPGNAGDSSYVRFKPAMSLFDLQKPIFVDLGKDQRVCDSDFQVTIRI